MKKSFYILIIVFLTTISCRETPNLSTSGEVIKNSYAQGFEISKIEEGYIIKLKDRLTKSESTHNYLLSSKGDYESGNNEIIHIPVTKVVCLSSTHCAFISCLEKTNSIKGISGLNYIYNDEIRKSIQMGEISEIGYDSQINLEKIIALNPDVVFAYGIDNSSMAGYEKLQEIGIPVIFVTDFLEETPLGRTEWIKFFSCFYDNFDYANEYFDSVANNYEQIKSEVSKTAITNPEVILNLPWKGTWWVPGKDSYFANFINDAGGIYKMTDKKGHESIPLSLEEIFANAQNAQIWLNPNSVIKKSEITNVEPRLKDFSPVNNCRIYNNNKRLNRYGGNDFYESGILHPDIILKDLVSIFHNNEPENELYYYQSVK
ncbi:MAG: ABC transporter substrate-binding protein [Bacteroidales bacterium]|nr:ABC transporter substrate-binding protein [Bacteroidales bacterium]